MRLLKRTNGLIKREHIDKTHAFYEKHGGKTILFARFLPIIRTFAPFVAGIGLMRYRLFVVFSALGSVAVELAASPWQASFLATSRW